MKPGAKALGKGVLEKQETQGLLKLMKLYPERLPVTCWLRTHGQHTRDGFRIGAVTYISAPGAMRQGQQPLQFTSPLQGHLQWPIAGSQESRYTSKTTKLTVVSFLKFNLKPQFKHEQICSINKDILIPVEKPIKKPFVKVWKT